MEKYFLLFDMLTFYAIFQNNFHICVLDTKQLPMNIQLCAAQRTAKDFLATIVDSDCGIKFLKTAWNAAKTIHIARGIFILKKDAKSINLEVN